MLTNMLFVISNNTNLINLSIKTLSDVKKHVGGASTACEMSQKHRVKANSLLRRYIKRKVCAA